MCRCMRIMLVRMRQSAVDGRKVLSGRPAGVALPRRALVPVAAAHQVPVVVVQQPGHPQQVAHPHEVRSQVLHHRLLRARVEIQLPAEDGREYVELLVRGHLVGGRGGHGGRRIAQPPQAGRYALEIQLDAFLYPRVLLHLSWKI